MTQLCGDVGDEDNPVHMSVRVACLRVSGEDGFHFERVSEVALITVSSWTTRRLFGGGMTCGSTITFFPVKFYLSGLLTLSVTVDVGNQQK